MHFKDSVDSQILHCIVVRARPVILMLLGLTGIMSLLFITSLMTRTLIFSITTSLLGCGGAGRLGLFHGTALM